VASKRQQLDALIEKMVPEVRRIFLDVMQGIVDDAFLDEMIKAIERGDPDALFRATGFTPAALQPILDAIDNVYQRAGDAIADGFPDRIQTPTGPVVFRWNMRNTAVEDELRNRSSAMVTRLTEEARDNVRAVLQRGVAAGDNPLATALNIVGRIDPVTKERVGGVIGLTTQQERWVANAKNYLQTADTQYFNLELRDRRFDSIVKKAFDSGTTLPDTTIDKLLTAYKNKALKFRADTIARTETIQSINRTDYLLHKQAITDGTLQNGAVSKEWDDVGDRKTRFTHAIMGSKYGKGKAIGIDDPFVSPSGARLLFPGDSSLGAGPEEIVNCRCKSKIVVDFTYGVE
jgi:hypothetical protein